MKELQRLLSYIRRAVDDYHMIEDGDRIAVGVSGGKDSLALLFALSALSRFYPKHFEVTAITVNMGLSGMDFSPIAAFCTTHSIPYICVKTEIAKIIFDIRQETNPCSLCAKMRRGVLHDAAKEAGCNKVALGHHADDVVETFMLNLFFEGRIGTFSPVTYLSRRDLTLIRPLLYAREKDIRTFARRAELPVIVSTCPEDHATERENMKHLLQELDERHHGLRHRIFGAICRGEIDGFHPTDSIAKRGNHD